MQGWLRLVFLGEEDCFARPCNERLRVLHIGDRQCVVGFRRRHGVSLACGLQRDLVGEEEYIDSVGNVEPYEK
jgi:hypothetical protein